MKKTIKIFLMLAVVSTVSSYAQPDADQEGAHEVTSPLASTPAQRSQTTIFTLGGGIGAGLAYDFSSTPCHFGMVGELNVNWYFNERRAMRLGVNVSTVKDYADHYGWTHGANRMSSINKRYYMLSLGLSFLQGTSKNKILIGFGPSYAMIKYRQEIELGQSTVSEMHREYRYGAMLQLGFCTQLSPHIEGHIKAMGNYYFPKCAIFESGSSSKAFLILVAGINVLVEPVSKNERTEWAFLFK